MLARIRKSQESESGFTLIELLVVMIIIGILAAIAIPVFLNQRKKAQDSAAKADVSTLGKEIATYYVDNCSVPVVAKEATAVAASAATGTATAGLGVPAGHYSLSAPTSTGAGVQPVADTKVDLARPATTSPSPRLRPILATPTGASASRTTRVTSRITSYPRRNGLTKGVCPYVPSFLVRRPRRGLAHSPPSLSWLTRPGKECRPRSLAVGASSALLEVPVKGHRHATWHPEATGPTGSERIHAHRVLVVMIMIVGTLAAIAIPHS